MAFKVIKNLSSTFLMNLSSLSYTPGSSFHQSYIYGAEYQIYQNSSPLGQLNDHNVPMLYVMFPLEYHI